MKVLIGCEESQIVCKAFRARGHEAYSCDIQPCSGGHPEWHIQEDILKVIKDKWDLLIAFPPCTYLATSGNRHIKNNPERWEKQFEAIRFVYNLRMADIGRIGIENPKSILSTYIGKPDQIIHPYYFGDPVPKQTCLWLKNLPPLKYTLHNTLFEQATAVEPEYIEYSSARTKSGKSKYSIFGKLGSGHSKERSKTFPGIAHAMAEQWG